MKPHKSAGFVKVRRGGECFWAEVLSVNADGSGVARSDSNTVDPAAPRYNEVFRLAADEELFGAMSSLPRLRVIK